MPSQKIKQIAEAADRVMTGVDGNRLQKAARKANDFYRGLSRKWMQPYEGERSEDFATRSKPPVNVTKRVTNTFLSHIYGKEVRRSFESETNNTFYEEMVLRPNSNFALDGYKWQKEAELTGISAVVPRFDRETKKFHADSFSADKLVPIFKRNDKDKMEALVLVTRFDDALEPDPLLRTGTRKEIWTKDEFAVMENDSVVRENGDLVEGTHQFGEIPAAFFMADTDHTDFFPVPPAADIVEMHQAVEEMMSTFGEVMRYQSFNLIMFKNPGAETVIASPKKWINTTAEGADVKAVSFQNNLAQLAEGIRFYFNMISDQGEIPAFLMTGAAAAESGVALTIRFVPHQQAVDRRKTLFKKAELDLMRLFVKLGSQEKASVDTSEKGMAGTVDYADLILPRSIDETIADNEWRLSRNLTTAVELIMEGNPELTEEQAKKLLMDNTMTNQELNAARAITPERMQQGLTDSAVARARQQAEETPPTEDVRA